MRNKYFTALHGLTKICYVTSCSAQKLLHLMLHHTPIVAVSTIFPSRVEQALTNKYCSVEFGFQTKGESRFGMSSGKLCQRFCQIMFCLG
mmetsp:Transcript_30707/g.48131  ORF Transcript_30707/g.48131 Transcript_30707/m.48131 type:complete len:90 (+) Transcript_30707:25-294(+)